MKYILLIIFLSTTLTFSQNGNIAELLNKWENRDGETYISLGFQIAKSFVMNDSMFFAIMELHKKQYLSWLDELQQSVFTIYKYSDTVDVVLETASLDKLKSIMIEKALKYKDHITYKKVANLILDKLYIMKIKLID